MGGDEFCGMTYADSVNTPDEKVIIRRDEIAFIHAVDDHDGTILVGLRCGERLWVAATVDQIVEGCGLDIKWLNAELSSTPLKGICAEALGGR